MDGGFLKVFFMILLLSSVLKGNILIYDKTFEANVIFYISYIQKNQSVVHVLINTPNRHLDNLLVNYYLELLSRKFNMHNAYYRILQMINKFLFYKVT